MFLLLQACCGVQQRLEIAGTNGPNHERLMETRGEDFVTAMINFTGEARGLFEEKVTAEGILAKPGTAPVTKRNPTQK